MLVMQNIFDEQCLSCDVARRPSIVLDKQIQVSDKQRSIVCPGPYVSGYTQNVNKKVGERKYEKLT